MTPYVLIWVLSAHLTGPSTMYSGSAEFNSKETCIAAGKLMLERTTKLGMLYNYEMLECVKK